MEGKAIFFRWRDAPFSWEREVHGMCKRGWKMHLNVVVGWIYGLNHLGRVLEGEPTQEKNASNYFLIFK